MGMSGEWTKQWIGYLSAAFFGLGIPIALIQLVPAGAYLRLDQEGFTVCNLFRTERTRWSVVDRFFVVSLDHTGVTVRRMVGFNFVPSYDRARLGRRIAKALGNCEGGLPDTYGMKAEDLANLMNAWLARYRQEADGRFHKGWTNRGPWG
jgi:hypothetical protein